MRGRLINRKSVGVALVVGVGASVPVLFMVPTRAKPELHAIASSPSDFGLVFTVVFTNCSRIPVTLDGALRWAETPALGPDGVSQVTCLASNTVWFRKGVPPSKQDDTLLPGEYGFLHVPVATNADRFMVMANFSTEGSVGRKFMAWMTTRLALRSAFVRSSAWMHRHGLFEGRARYTVTTGWMPNQPVPREENSRSAEETNRTPSPAGSRR